VNNNNTISESSILLALKSSLPLALSILVIRTAGGLSSFPFRDFLSSLVSPLFMSAVLAVPTITFCLGLAILFLKDCGKASLATTCLAGFIGVSLVALLWAWYRNRSHKYLSLLNKGELGISVLITMSFCASMMIATTKEEFLLPSLLACAIATLSCSAFAATADVWYTVSTGQFWMCTLDLATGGLYILLPLVLLGCRFRELYGTLICNTLLQQSQDILPPDDIQSEQITMTALVQMLALSSMMGITMIRVLCPFGAHLYSRVYVHGQPNTKMIALCIIIDNWIDTGEQLLSAISNLDNTSTATATVLLNFVLTTEELQTHNSSLKAAKAAGHTIMPYTNDEPHREYSSLFSQEVPEWSHGGGSSPSDFISCSERDTKIALWSHYYDSNSPPSVKEVKESRGGSIVCLKQQPIPLIVDFIQKITQEEGYTVAPLSKVVKDDPAMSLSTNIPSQTTTTTGATPPVQNESE